MAAEKAHKIEKLKSAFEFILNKEVSNIAANSNLDYFLVRSHRKVDPTPFLQPFCPMVSFEIIDITDDTVICKWVKRVKKKTLITYQLELKYEYEQLGISSYGKLVLNSFDINKAKQLEP